MIGVLEVKISAHAPNMALCPCFTFKGSPSSLRIMGCPKQIGQWRITDVYATFHYPDDSEKTKLSVREGNVYVATVDGCQTTGKVENGLTISANGIDEDGNAVTGYVLGRGDIYVMEGDSVVPDPGVVKNYVKLCDSLPDTPAKGDAYFQNGVLVIYDGTSWVPSADVHGDYIEDADGNKICADRTVQYIEEVANWTDIYYPDSPLNWDAENNWWRVDVSPSLYMKLQFNSGTWTFEIRENIGGEWVVDSDSVQDTQEATVLDFNVAGASHTLNKGVQQIQTTGELALKSDLPTKTSELTNDSGFITSADVHGDYIEDANGNKIEADGDFTYLDSNKWSVDCGQYGKYVLSPTATEEWTYAEAEGIDGNKKVVLKWIDYQQCWGLKYYQWAETILGWQLLASGVGYDSYQATSLEIEITGDFTATAECRKGAPSTDKLATEGYVNGIVGNINSVLDFINGEVI